MIIVKKGNIIYEDVDVIVNATNSRLAGGGGVDSTIRLAAGGLVITELSTFESCPPGKAVMTSGGNLRVKKIIHTVGPVWQGGDKGEEETLRSAYEECFKLAKEENLESIAFPAISTGAYGYPKEPATRIAFEVARKHENEFKEIRFVCYSDGDLAVYKKVENEKS